MTRVTLIAGGVGGAKLAEGFYALEGVELTVIGNVGDDEAFHGLWVSPDIDTMLYTLSGRIDRAQGWGVADESTRALATLSELGAETWMTLGDRDLGLHIWRTMQRGQGAGPQEITDAIARAFGLSCRIVLPTEDVVQTRLRIAAGWLSFQEYFVRERHAPEVLEIAYEGAAQARAARAALAALRETDLIVIAPSNPLLSIAPILAVSGIKEALRQARAPRMAVSPLIGGTAVKGPAAQLMRGLGAGADVAGVAAFYEGLIDRLVIDAGDSDFARAIGVACSATDIMMRDAADKARLAAELLRFAGAEAAA